MRTDLCFVRPDLSTHGDWESVSILSHVQAGTIDGKSVAIVLP